MCYNLRVSVTASNALCWIHGSMKSFREGQWDGLFIYACQTTVYKRFSGYSK